MPTVTEDLAVLTFELARRKEAAGEPRAVTTAEILDAYRDLAGKSKINLDTALGAILDLLDRDEDVPTELREQAHEARQAMRNGEIDVPTLDWVREHLRVIGDKMDKVTPWAAEPVAGDYFDHFLHSPPTNPRQIRQCVEPVQYNQYAGLYILQGQNDLLSVELRKRRIRRAANSVGRFIDSNARFQRHDDPGAAAQFIAELEVAGRLSEFRELLAGDGNGARAHEASAAE